MRVSQEAWLLPWKRHRRPPALAAAFIAMIVSIMAVGCGAGNAQRASTPHEFGSNGTVVIQDDGKIVAANGWGTFGIARYRRDGGLDSRFGTGGKAVTDVHSRYGSGVSAVAIQADHKIVALGVSNVGFPDPKFGGGSVSALARYLPDGRLDPRFGSEGKLLGKLGPNSGVAIAGGVQSNGEIVAVESICCQPYNTLRLARYRRDGSLDRGFGTGGKVLNSDFSPSADVAIESDGKIVLVGWRWHATRRSEAALVRYLPNGRPDMGFGDRGMVRHFKGGLVGIAVQPDGKIVAAGSIDSKFALLRYTADGHLDSDFGSGGLVTTDFGPAYGDRASAVALQADGKLVVGGSHGVGPEPIHAFLRLARYLPGGQLDAGFGKDGKVVSKNFGPVEGIAIEDDGKIIAVGRRSPSLVTPGGRVVIRYTPDGKLDTSFGARGS